MSVITMNDNDFIEKMNTQLLADFESMKHLFYQLADSVPSICVLNNGSSYQVYWGMGLHSNARFQKGSHEHLERAQQLHKSLSTKFKVFV